MARYILKYNHHGDNYMVYDRDQHGAIASGMAVDRARTVAALANATEDLTAGMNRAISASTLLLNGELSKQRRDWLRHLRHNLYVAVKEAPDYMDLTNEAAIEAAFAATTGEGLFGLLERQP